MLNLLEYRQKPAMLADWLWYVALVAPGTILLKDGSLLRAVRFRGPDLDSSTSEELISAMARLNNALRRLGSGWVTYVEARRIAADFYPESTFPNRASKLFDQERQKMFEEEGAHFDSDYIFSIQWKPPADNTEKATKIFFTSTVSKNENPYIDHINTFTARSGEILDLIHDLVPDFRPMNDSEILTYLHDCISSRHHPVAVPETPMYLDVLLADDPVTGGIHPMVGDYHVRVISVTGFPGKSVPGLLDSLNRLAIPYRWYTRFIHLSKDEALKDLERIRRHWFTSLKSAFQLLREAATNVEATLVNPDALAQTEDVTDALAELGDDLVAYGYLSLSVVLMDKDPDVLNEQIEHVKQTLGSIGFNTITETVNALEAWLGTHPGNPVANVRQYIMSTLNIAHMLPFSAVWAGPLRDDHLDGPPLMHTRTQGATPFRLSLHRGDVGHTLIAGPTGAGKSVLLSSIALSFMRYPDAQVFLFDKGRSSRVAILAMGGEFFDLAADGTFAFQPLAHIDDERNRAWAAEWIASIVEKEGVVVDPDKRNEIWAALQNLAAPTVEPRFRTIGNFCMVLQSPELRGALQRYTKQGPFGKLLDADQEKLNISSVCAFEMETLMATPDLVWSVLSYLFHVLEARFDGRPTILVLDEAWLFLDNPVFAKQIREWLKTLRKYNVSVIFATQSISDIANSSIAPAIMESCPTRIFLPYANATSPDAAEFYKRLGLNEAQIEIISVSTPKRHYYFQSTDGNRLFDLGFTPGSVGLALAASTSKEDQSLVDEILAQFGPENFLENFLTAKGFDHDALF